jgi:hypothetical protein
VPLPFPGGETIILRRMKPTGARDAYGAVVYVAHDETLRGVVIYPQSSTEVAQGQERSRIALTVVLPAEVLAVDAVDRIVWRSKEYEVEGEPEPFQSPFTPTKLQTLTMYRVEG